MSELNDRTYAALITISLPGSDESATLTVTLAPADVVPVGERYLPLSECTLTDLQTFAAELEADVWDTYENINLLALDSEEQVNIRVIRSDSPDEPLADWSQFMLLLPDEPAPAEEDDEEERAFVADESTPLISDEDHPAEAAVETETGAEPPVSESQPVDEKAAADAAPDVTVADAEPVYPEIEKEKKAETKIEPAETMPHIQPSKARVRVAGQQLPGGNPTWAAVDILVDEPALRASQAHALSSLNREVAGFLIGPRPEKQPDGRYIVHIIDAIEAKHTLMQGASVTYTPESWRNAHDTLAERYPDETAVMVGWYHTHPGFGIFLSGMDLFIHQTFFTQIWHVAFVLDPRARSSGFFCWDRYKSRVSRHDFAWPYWAAGSW